MQKIPLSRPSITEREIARVAEVMRSGRIALGPVTAEFESKFCDLTGSKHAVAVSSGTAALHLIVRGLGIGPGDEVITTPYSFVASSNVALFEKATPVFCDIQRDTYNIDPDLIEAAITRRTKAILAVDVFGLPADWDELRDIAERNNLVLIDDSCEALGASVNGKPVGSLANASAFGFYPNKQITTGEGGCITTDSDELASVCRSMLNQGRSTPEKMEHVRLGYNYRLGEMAAAMGCCQLERLDELLLRREQLAESYKTLLETLANDLILPDHTDGRSWFVYVVELRDQYTRQQRDEVVNKLKSRGIGCSPYFPAIHLQPLYRQQFGFSRGDFPVCEHVADRTFAIPFYPDLSPADASVVATTLTEVLDEVGKSNQHRPNAAVPQL